MRKLRNLFACFEFRPSGLSCPRAVLAVCERELPVVWRAVWKLAVFKAGQQQQALFGFEELQSLQHVSQEQIEHSCRRQYVIVSRDGLT